MNKQVHKQIIIDGMSVWGYWKFKKLTTRIMYWIKTGHFPANNYSYHFWNQYKEKKKMNDRKMFWLTLWVAVGCAIGLLVFMVLWIGANERADSLANILSDDYIAVDIDGDGVFDGHLCPAIMNTAFPDTVVYEETFPDTISAAEPPLLTPEELKKIKGMLAVGDSGQHPNPTAIHWSAEMGNFHKTFLDFYGADSLVFSILKIDGRELPLNERYVGY